MVTTRIALAILAGGLQGASWLFPGAWYAAWAGHAGLIALGFLCAPRSAFIHGMLAGVVCNACGFYWGVEALRATMDASMPIAFALYGALVGFEAIAFGLFCWSVAVIARSGPRQFWLIPCVWVAIEFWYPRIFAWKLGYSQLEWIELLQIAELAGADGISFVMTAVAAIPAVLLLGCRSSVGHHSAMIVDRRFIYGYVVAAAALLVATLGFGFVRERQWISWARNQPQLKVALIQVDPAYVGAPKKLRERSLAVHDHVDLICWPETSIGTYSDELTHFRDVERTLDLSRDSQANLEPAKDLHCHLLAGGKLYSEAVTDEGPFAMAAFLISPSQDVLGKYKKRTLLPLGEYVPGQSYYPPLRHWMTIEHIIEAGNDAQPLTTASGAFLGVLMCYEDTIPRNARHTTAAGAEVLLSLIQGTAFENPLTLIQHQRLAVLRAVENRRYFLRCSSTGITCIIAPTGQLVASLPPHVEQTLIGDAAMLRDRTLYNVVGDSLSWLCSFLCLTCLFAANARRWASPVVG